MSFEKPPKIGELTKAYAPEERQKTAEEIRALRTQYFERIHSLDEKIAGLIPEKEEHRLKADQYAAERAQLEQELMELRASLFNRLFKGSKINVQTEKLEDLEEKARTCLAEFTRVSELLDTLEESRRDSGELESAKTALEAFYQKQSQLLPGYERRNQANERASSVESVMEDRQVFFVHGILPDYVPGENSLLQTSGVDWREKLKVALGLEPTLSASTIRKGDDRKNFWAHFGIILRQGSILEACDADGASVAVDVNSRAIGLYIREKEISNQVSSALLRAGQQRYNEFVIDGPKAAGLFVFPETDQDQDRSYRLSMPSHEDIAREISGSKMPVFIFKEGKFVPAKYDEKKRAYLPDGDPVEPADIAKMPSPISEESRSRLREEVMFDSPFKTHKLGRLAYLEFSMLLSYSDGRKTFTGLYMGRHKLAGGEKAVVRGEEVRTVSRFAEPGGLTHIYVDKEGKVWEEQTRKGKELNRRRISDDRYKGNYVHIGQNTWKLENGSVGGIKDYVRLMQLEVNSLVEKVKSEKEQETQLFYKKVIFRLASHCHGFADQAEELGDRMAAEAARQVANSALIKEELQGLSNRRLGPNGEMRITEEDIYHYDEDKPQAKKSKKAA